MPARFPEKVEVCGIRRPAADAGERAYVIDGCPPGAAARQGITGRPTSHRWPTRAVTTGRLAISDRPFVHHPGMP